MSTNVETIAEYRAMKQKVEALAAAAREQMKLRYAELLAEKEQLEVEFSQMFGENLAAETVRPADTPAGPVIGGLRRSLKAALNHRDIARYTQIAGKLADLGVIVPAFPKEPPAPTEFSAGKDVPLEEPVF